MKIEYNYVYKYGKLMGYSCKYGFIEKHYDKPYNYQLTQITDYRIPLLRDKGKEWIFKKLREAKEALEREVENEEL